MFSCLTFLGPERVFTSFWQIQICIKFLYLCSSKLFPGLVCRTAGWRGSRWQLRANPLHHGMGGEVLGRAQAGLQLCTETLHHNQVRHFYLSQIFMKLCSYYLLPKLCYIAY